MTERIKNIGVPVLLGMFLLVMLAIQVISHDKKFSDTERRALKTMPKVTKESLMNGKFMPEFETFTQDQFPGRDMFRGIKTAAALYIFGQKEVNDLYLSDGYVTKVEYPVKEEMIDYATERFQYIYDTYLKDENVTIFSCIIPDKNFFLGPKTGHLTMDYEELSLDFQKKTPYMQPIWVMDVLRIEDYYKTDTHWRQEKVFPVAERISEALDTPILPENAYTKTKFSDKFYGVYTGQIALPLEADELYYMTNDILDACEVTSFDTGKPRESHMYHMEKAAGKDPYELFLSGSDALITVENPNALTDKELVVFRDSFGSSLVPLLVPGYKKVTLIDIRYVQSNMIGHFVEFENQDVLFLYSALLLNNSLGLK